MELIGLSYSPWTEKARWALDHQGVGYRYREHLILFGMPELRWKTREWTRPLTVPALVDGRQSYLDSFEIALFADARGSSTRLFPKNRLDEIRGWNEVSEAALDGGRGVLMTELPKRPAALKEAMPPFMRPFGSVLLPMARFGTYYVSCAFEAQKKSRDQHEQGQRDALTRLREGLSKAGGEYLVDGELSYADIVMAVALQMVKPVSDEYVPLGPATRECWTNPRLAEEFADLLAWRDALYRKHRSKKTSRSSS